MSYDMFMQIKGIKGDSTDEAHKEWIEVLSYDHEVAQSEGALNSGGEYVGGKAEHKDFNVVKKLDKSSPTIFLYCCVGRPIQQITIELCRAMGDKTPFMKYTFKNAIIASVKPDGSHDDDDVLPKEKVSIRYTQIELEYTQTDPTSGGKKGASTKCSYDLRSDEDY